MEHHVYALFAFYAISLVHHHFGSRLNQTLADAARDFLIHLTVYSGLMIQLH